MQNKKPFLRRLLAIYITFFAVIIADLALEVGPGFKQGWSDGNEMGTDITKNWVLGAPRRIYMLENIRIAAGPGIELQTKPGTQITTQVRKIGLTIEEEAPGASILSLAFMLCGVAYLAIIVSMFLIIHSLRCSIREEEPLRRHNVGLLRLIGALAIATELIDDLVSWTMSSRAAELLAGSGYTVDTAFHVSYSRILMGVLILFAAEVFAVGRRLSEEQKLTI